MKSDGLDPRAFSEVVQQALDAVVVHRVQNCQHVDVQSITAIRAEIEDRLSIALEATEGSELTGEWSWRAAAQAIAGEIAAAIIQDKLAD